MKMTKFQKNQISSIFEIWWHGLNWMKTHPLEFFWTPYHRVKHHNGKPPQPFVTHTDFCLFLRCFWTSSEFSTLLVNTCWPKFSHPKIAPALLYKTLISDFSYLEYFRRYSTFRTIVRYFPFSNNYLQIRFGSVFMFTNLKKHLFEAFDIWR